MANYEMMFNQRFSNVGYTSNSPNRESVNLNQDMRTRVEGLFQANLTLIQELSHKEFKSYINIHRTNGLSDGIKL